MSGEASPVVVTGASGFIGRPLIRHLLREGWAVRAVSRSPGRGLSDLPVFEVRDLDDAAGLDRAMSGGGAVVHLAGLAHVTLRKSADSYDLYRRVNTAGTAAVLEAAQRNGVKKFVFTSSVRAVGEDSGEDRWDEGIEPAPVDPYGRSKLAAERLVLERAERSGMQAVALRLPLVYGPGMKANMLTLFRAVQSGVPLFVAGARNRKSLLFTGNLTAAVAALLRTSDMGRGVYFLSDGQDVSTEELVRRIGRALGREARILWTPALALDLAARVEALARAALGKGGGSRIRKLTGSLAVDPTAFFRAFDFRPPLSLDAGLSETAEWFRSVQRQTGPAAS